MRRHHPSSRKRAFTLIELLVVISIIALLIALLLPALAAARRSAETAQCLANTRSLGQAYYNYAADNNGEFMLYVVPSSKGLWTANLREYLGEARRTNSNNVPIAYFPTTFCTYAPQRRSDDEIARLRGGTVGSATTPWYHAWHQQPDGGVYGGSYGMNGYLYHTRDWRSADPRFPNLVENVSDTTKMPAFGDALWVDGWPAASNPKPASFENLSGTLGSPHMWRFAIDRHEGKQNFSFVDGHAETVEVERLWELEWHNDNYRYP